MCHLNVCPKADCQVMVASKFYTFGFESVVVKCIHEHKTLPVCLMWYFQL